MAQAAEAGRICDGELFSKITPTSGPQRVEREKMERPVRRNAQVFNADNARQKRQQVSAQFFEEL
jgi:hypothetical protein